MSVPRTHSELDALLDLELQPLVERLARDHCVLLTSVATVEYSSVSTVRSNLRPSDVRIALRTALDAYPDDDDDDDDEGD